MKMLQLPIHYPITDTHTCTHIYYVVLEDSMIVFSAKKGLALLLVKVVVQFLLLGGHPLLSCTCVCVLFPRVWHYDQWPIAFLSVSNSIFLHC